MPLYALVIRNRDPDWSLKASSERERIYLDYHAWLQEARDAGTLLTSHALRGTGGRSLREVDDRLVDGPYAETKETVGGFFILDLPDLEAAVTYARKCPALAMGDGVDVREVSDEPTKVAPAD